METLIQDKIAMQMDSAFTLSMLIIVKDHKLWGANHWLEIIHTDRIGSVFDFQISDKHIYMINLKIINKNYKLNTDISLNHNF